MKNLLAKSTQTVTLGVPGECIDIAEWLLTLTDDEYRQCSKAHIAAGASRTSDGRRMSINVEDPGGTLLIQRYVEELATRTRCRMVSDTDVFTPLGRSRYRVVWELGVSPRDLTTSTFANQVEVYSTDELLKLLEANGASVEQASTAAQTILDEHNAEETSLFALNIEAKAGTGRWAIKTIYR